MEEEETEEKSDKKSDKRMYFFLCSFIVERQRI